MIYPYEYPGMDDIMKNVKFNLIRTPQKPGLEVSEILTGLNNFSKSEVEPIDRFITSVSIYKAAYEAFLFAIENVMLTHPVISKLLKEDKKKLIFITDGLANSFIEYALFHNLEFVVINTASSMYGYGGVPKYFPQLPFETISLTRGREIIREEGLLSYFTKVFYERVYLFIKFIYNVYPALTELNNFRIANGLPKQNGPFVEVVDRVNIHFTVPSAFEYNFAYPRNHIFVGFNYLPNQSMSKLPSFNTSEIVASDDQLVDNWLDKKKKEDKYVVYIAFGTKVTISLQHIRNIIKGVLQTKSEKQIEVLVVYGRKDPLKVKEQIFDTPLLRKEDKERVFVQNWVKQPIVLRHPSIKLFISHAGAHSLLESIDAEVPLLLFPIFGDQFLNSLRAEDAGIARAIFHVDNEKDCDSLTKEVEYILQHENEMKKKMYRVKILNREIALENVQLFNEEESTKLSLSPNTLAAANVIGKVSKYGSEVYAPSDIYLSSWQKVDILQVTMYLVLTLVFVPILIVSKKCCCKGK
ncbi:hypothetical protein ABK040_009302 [Willaertia magna]